MIRSFEALVERARQVASPEGFNAFVARERLALPGASERHKGVLTGMRVQGFQNWQLERNAEWKLTDVQLLALMRLEFPGATGQVFTADVHAALKILEGIRAHYNRDGHNGPSPQSKGLAPSVSYGRFDSVESATRRIEQSRVARPSGAARVAAPTAPPAPPPLRPEDPSQGGLLARLDVYYREHGISAVEFRCRKASHCRATSPRFTTAKETYVGPAYEAGSRPRLLFLSLDSGSASSTPEEKTMAAVRQQTLATDVDNLHGGKHWYLTHALAFELLRQFHPSLTISTSNRYFAHVNSAKCCANNVQRAKAASILFENCRPYIPRELQILAPDVIVTQGDEARDVIESMGVQSPERRDVSGALLQRGVVALTTMTSALWLHTYHPNARYRFRAQQKQVWPLYQAAVRQFMSERLEVN